MNALVRMATIALIVSASATVAGDAAAHTRSQSRSTWRITGDRASAVFSVTALEVTRLGEVAAAEMPLVYARHLSETVGVRAGDARCRRVGQPTPLPAEPGFVRVELSFSCDHAPVSTIEVSSFLSVAPSHLHMADVRVAGGPPQDYLLSDATRSRVIVSGAGEQQTSSLAEYFAVGVKHILAGWDHLAFVAVLLLLCTRLREVVFTITGFTLGHSLTLGTAVLGWLVPNPAAVEALIGYTIAIAALESSVADPATAARAAATAGAVGVVAAICAAASGAMAVAVACAGLVVFAVCYLLRRGDGHHSAVSRSVLTTVFGLIHGLGFASVLIDMELPTDRLLVALLGFNVGVEVGQLLVVALLSVIVAAGASWLRPRAASLMHTLACSALGGLGVFWLVSRSIG